MSWWISLCENEKPCVVEAFEEGGTQALGGSTDADLNVTYNYGKHFRFPNLAGMTGEQSIPLLSDAVERLGVERDADYWAPTEGNVGYACAILLSWARQYPAATWCVS